MADVKQILVVDDHFEMLEFLRLTLEHSGHDYQVLAVPSAEEGMLELLRTPFDLLITDVRLPGMSGFDLIRRVRRARKELPVIMISGYGVEQGQKEAAALDVVHYFVKPLDSDLLLQTVQRTLFGEPDPVPLPAETAPTTAQLPPELATTFSQRLQMLRNEISATYVALADIRGRVLTESGIGVGLITPDLLIAIAESLRHSQIIANHLNNQDAFTMNYQTGNKVELYAMTIGEGHLLLIFFTAESRRGRVGTVWVFAQRFAKELLPLLPESSAAPSDAFSVGPLPRSVPDLPDFPAKTPSQKDKPQRTDRPVEKPTPAAQPVEKLAPEKSLPTSEPSAAAPPPADSPVFSFADALKQGLIPDALVPGEVHPSDQGTEEALTEWLELPTDGANADEDWLAHAAAAEPLPDSEGLSFEEALRLGLLPPALAEAPVTGEVAELSDFLALSEKEAAELDGLSDLAIPAAAANQEGMFSLEQAQSLGLVSPELSETTPGTADDVLADLFKITPDEAVDLEGFWDAAIAQADDTSLPGLSLEEAQAEGILTPDLAALDVPDLVPADLEALFNAPVSDELDLDAFWDEAVAQERNAAAPHNLSLEEAHRQGLIQDPTWNQDE